jgi:hypothetical protein
VHVIPLPTTLIGRRHAGTAVQVATRDDAAREGATP